ncbi:MAG: hypothetical protein K2Q97_10315 [Burkholderiaceae bacterium]|nr:hypothetical protein [Burkholderiaceae bacterium]
MIRGNGIAAIKAYAAKDMSPAIDPLQDVLDALGQAQLDTARALYEAAQVSYARTQMAVFAGITAGVLLALGFCILVIRSILRELGTEPSTATTLARSVAQGDLTVSIHLKPGNTTSLMVQHQEDAGQLGEHGGERAPKLRQSGQCL